MSEITIALDEPASGKLIEFLNTNAKKARAGVAIYMKDGKALSSNGKFIAPHTETVGETWVLNERGIIPLGFSYSISFISNNQNFSNMAVTRYLMYDNTAVTNGLSPALGGYEFTRSNFLDQSYRTITFFEAPTGDLLSWLQDNGVKQ